MPASFLRRAAVAASVPLIAGSSVLLAPTAHAAAKPVVIAVLDTGVNPAHQEFGSGQIAAWWDFTATQGATVLPGAGQTWDPRRGPYDDNGHGSITAAMAAGRGFSAQETKSFAPGTSLAIAKVGDAAGSIPGDIAAAIRWSVNTVHADVINMSFGAAIPEPVLGSLDPVEAALSEAKAAGVLVTVANGNGNANAGVPGASGPLTSYACSPYVLSVGAAGLDGFLVHDDPEMVAQFTVTGPDHNTTNGYITESGTSFSSPLTASYGAKLISEARAVGRDPKADTIEKLIKYSARDSAVVPPTYEGFGTIDAASLPAAVTNAKAGTFPAANQLNSIYVDTYAAAQRQVACGL